MKIWLNRFLLWTRFFEVARESPNGHPCVLMVLPDEVLSGRFETARDVEIHGTVVADIVAPQSCVTIFQGGAFERGSVTAREFRWQGSLGNVTVECAHVEVSATATTLDGTPSIHHDTMLVELVRGLEAHFKRRSRSEKHGLPSLGEEFKSKTPAEQCC